MSLREELLFLRAAARMMGDPAAQEKCFRLLRQGAPYDQLFFGELSDPDWLPVLTERGFFRCLPLAYEVDGIARHPWHLPLQSLTTLAGQAPRTVAQLLRSMHIPANPASQDQAMRAITAIKDPTCIDDVLPVLQRILQSLSTTNWLWLDEVLSRWLEQGAVDACFGAVATFLRTAIAVYEEGKPAGDRWRLSEIDEKVIVPLADADPLRVASLLSETLIIWAESERARAFADRRDTGVVPEFEEDPVRDFPRTYWIEDFKTGSFMDRNVEGMLAHRLYFVGETVFRNERAPEIAAFDALLRRNRWHLFSRLRWQLYADFPEQTLEWARRDVLARLPRLGHPDAEHEHEMAEMLKAHVAAHSNKLLDENEVERFAATVLNATADDPAHERSHHRFQRLQLFPISPLLQGEALNRYRQLSAGQVEIPPHAYQPWHLSTEGGVVEQRSPVQADNLGDLTDADLWRLLNEWTPSSRSERLSFLVEETVDALGKEFAVFVQAHMDRFSPASQWWKQIHRPAILCAPLDLATTRLNGLKGNADERVQPSADEWLVWLGLAARLANPSGSDEAYPDHPDAGWEWPRIVAAKFLSTICQTATSQSALPSDWPGQVHRLLDEMMRAGDPRLDESPTPFMGGWYTTAINSVRGVALEGLLQLALHNEKNRGDPAFHAALFRTVEGQLSSSEVSPALFAVIGAHLRLTVHLFTRELQEQPSLLLPSEPSERKTALFASHFLYDRPMVGILTALPDFPLEALKVLGELGGRDQDKEPTSKDFGGRLGTHLGFYDWNRAFRDDETGQLFLDAFFRLASPGARASTVADIGRVFSGVEAAGADRTACERAMALWERRFAQIGDALAAGGEPANFQDELGEFFDWFECECFPFEWRVSHLLQAIDSLDKAPRSFSLLDQLKDYSAVPDRLDRVVEVFHRLLARPSDELRWSYQAAVVRTLLERGFAAANPATRRLTLEAQERLLGQGLFDSLDVEPSAVPSGTIALSQK